MKEKWIQINKIQGFEEIKDQYWISNNDKDTVVNRNTGKILKLFFHKDGYPIVNLRTIDGKPKHCRIHVLKARAFIYTPNPLGADQVRHLDDCKTNNSLTNLAFGTRSDNMQDCMRNGNYNYEAAARGRARGKNKGSHIRNKRESKPVKCIETGIIYPSVSEVSRQTDINYINVSRCCNGKYNTAGGFHFEFVNKEEI